MKKTLNEATIINELRGASSFFPKLQPTNHGQPNGASERVNRTVKPNATTERPKRTGKPNGKTERVKRTVFTELKKGVVEEGKRKTKRYSFEIYLDQEETINQLKAKYQVKTGKRLSGSRVIREALDVYLKNFDDPQEPNG
jgi:hypothetical protein